MFCCQKDYFFLRLTCDLRVKVSSHILMNEPKEVLSDKRKLRNQACLGLNSSSAHTGCVTLRKALTSLNLTFSHVKREDDLHMTRLP